MRSRADACALIAVLLSAAPAAAQEASCHDGVAYEGGIRWRSHLPIDGTSAPVVVPRELEVEHIDGGYVDERSVIIPTSALGGVVVVARQPVADRADVTLRPPFTAGPQRITLDVPFAPRVDGPIARELGYFAAPGVTREQRRFLAWRCGEAPRGSTVLYVQAERPRGAWRSREERTSGVLFVGAALLAVALVAGALLYRAFGRRAALERAELILNQRFDALEENADREAPRS